MPEAKQCQLLGGPEAWAAQGLLALVAVGALLYKRYQERPQRSLPIWGMDVSKQVVSSGAAHVCGVITATLISAAGRKELSDCAWYFVAFSFDTTLGVALAIGLHSVALKEARRRGANEGKDTFFAAVANCGNYGTPPQWSIFWPQLAEWTTAVLIARLLCGFVVFLLREVLVHVARILDIMFQGHPTVLLYFVMIACPLVMNLAQALVQDLVLKWKKPHENGTTGQAARDLEIPDDVSLLPTHIQSSEI